MSPTPQAYLAVHLACELRKAESTHKIKELERIKADRAKRIEADRLAKLNRDVLCSE